RRMFGFQNIELISDRPLKVWLEECRIIKDKYPDNVLIGSCMASGEDKASWQELVVRLEEAGCDMVELNLGCPHGMPERGMGSVCSQNPEITGNITRWVKEVAKKPFIVKLSPNVTDITVPGRGAADNGAPALTAINTVNVLMGVDIERFEPLPNVHGKTTYGGYSGEAVRPIALKAVSDLARKLPGMPISATGGIADWRDAVEFLLCGATTLQVCTEVMLRGFGIITPMTRGLERYLSEHGFGSIADMIGLAVPKITDHSKLDFSYKPKAVIDAKACIKCDMCYIACEDAAYQAIEIRHARTTPVKDKGVPIVHLGLCTGCSLCQHVCPVDCITMEEVPGAPALVKDFMGLSVGENATYPGASRWKKLPEPASSL
ncbi:MAG: NAD-dependent dihydropyrimidine dehydrogenase subunit PreA, partial [Cyanobacteria bacterium REEB65]|nr:NAD-dependent dihydropyrimidine dehydrogenase subunit PreA [Cyanobacteria bacterium REEB65]